MALAPGTRIGGYEIVSLLGAGGMGEVYRGRDSRLGRDVAIKILSPAIAADADGLLRFEREARMLAALNHPNIAAIYGIDDSVSPPALILELVDGETLADRIARGPIPAREAIAIGRQIAEALDTAHEAGIVHRDLKPANIKITEAGQIKVLDFGLAKALAAAAGESSDINPANSPTITVHGTQQGVILGTAAYMSPEQARGKRIDKGTDIWAFGCVLFEMLTGKRAFDGETTSDIIAAIIERGPNLDLLPRSTPGHLRRIIERCCEKDPKRRARDIADVRADLDAAVIATPAPTPASATRRLWPIALVAGLAAGFLLAMAIRGAPQHTTLPIVRSSLLLPEGVSLSRAVMPLKMTADGSAIAYIGQRGGEERLYVQRFDQAEPMLLPGTEGAEQPFFSPDARWIGYFADHALQKIASDGQSAPLRLARIEGGPMGAAWGPNDTIVWAVRGGGLLTMNAAGGTPKAIAGVASAAYPEWLPDGRSILFTTGRDGSDARAFATIGIDGGSPKVIAQLTESSLSGPPVLGTGGNLAQAQFVEPGFIVFGQAPGAVRALPVDPQSLSATGAPIPLADNIERGAAGGAVFFATSRNGRLVSAPTGERHQLVWVDRSGRESPVSSDRMSYRFPRISPDGKTIAVAANDETRRSDIWLYDTLRGTRSRLTTSFHNLNPLWTKDGTAIIVSAAGLVRLPLAGDRSVISSPEQYRSRIPRGTAPYAASWAPDGSILAQANSEDIWRITAAGEAQPVLAREVDDWEPMMSPDGKWLAHTSRESGRAEVYLRRYPELDRKIMVSTEGGAAPVWARDGHEIFYRQGDAMMAVKLELGTEPRAGSPTRLFSGRYLGTAGDLQFDVAADGRFVMIKSDPASELRRLAMVQNWFEGHR